MLIFLIAFATFVYFIPKHSIPKLKQRFSQHPGDIWFGLKWLAAFVILSCVKICRKIKRKRNLEKEKDNLTFGNFVSCKGNEGIKIHGSDDDGNIASIEFVRLFSSVASIQLTVRLANGDTYQHSDQVMDEVSFLNSN